MSERDDDERVEDERTARDDTIPEAHAGPAPSDAGSGSDDDTGAAAAGAATTSPLESAALADLDATVPDQPSPLQESPERAGRRVARVGLRIGTRLALALVLTSVLPTALAASAVLLLRPPPPLTMPSLSPPEPLTMQELRAALAELAAAEASLARASNDGAAETQQRAVAALDEALATMAKRVEEARAERAADDDGENDDDAVTVADIEGDLSALGITRDGTRRLVSEEGAVLAPAGAALKTPAAALPTAAKGAAAKVVDAGGAKLLVVRGCVAGSGLCLLDELPSAGEAPSLVTTRVALRKAMALAPVLPSGAPAPPADIDAVRRRVVVGALVLALFASLLLASRLRKDLTAPLSSLAARLRLLASGQPSDRSSRKLPAELIELDDAADALCSSLGAVRARDDADRRRAERLFSLAEGVDAVARGQLSTRLPSSDDVAEATLSSSVNRMIEAFERQIVRLKSHAQLLAASADGARGFDEDGDENDPAALIEKRVSGLRPIPPLLTDIASRLSTLSRMPAGEPRVPEDLAKLAEAIAQRARAAQALFDSLEGQLARLPRGSGSSADGLTPDQQRALAKLVDDLQSLTVDSSLPRLVESLSDLPASDLVSRLARAPTSA